MSKKETKSQNEDYERLAGLLSASLTLVIMANAIDGYFDTVYEYFSRRLPSELATLSTLGSYGLFAGIAFYFFKIVLTAILLGSVVSAARNGGSPFGVLGF
ncbi:hypothetical protein [Sedimentitalea nanhaiensis]|uniref:Uncharacterized protein n=1 Tax=Sedimentitalea nanhaiensis TaxID=999627 RepID=A0A1I7E3W5_9RHOB|nr:hypothetical protein [Sedimentitalea nanhaiensis]SFU18622.1 hypothetical protein SAMN05216236_14322 [Sedimentitalea nanhaiensis]